MPHFFEDIFPMKDRVATGSEASTTYTPKPIVVSVHPVYIEQVIEDNNTDAPRMSKI
jgi:hypothetical protein